MSDSFDITFVCTLNCMGTYNHRMTIADWEPATGGFVGTGVYDDPSYTWSVSGTIKPPETSFSLVYTGINRGYTATMSGIADSTGAPVSGIGTSSENQTYTWTAKRTPPTW